MTGRRAPLCGKAVNSLPVFALGGGPTVDEWLRGTPDPGGPPLPDATGEPLFLVLLRVSAFFLLLVFLGWVALRLARQRKGNFPAEGAEVLFRVPLAPGKYVAALRLGRSVYLLGVGEDVHLLEVLAAEEFGHAPPPQDGLSPPPLGGRFFPLFAGAAEKSAPETDASLPAGNGRGGTGEDGSPVVTEEERRLRDLFRRGD